MQVFRHPSCKNTKEKVEILSHRESVLSDPCLSWGTNGQWAIQLPQCYIPSHSDNHFTSTQQASESCTSEHLGVLDARSKTSGLLERFLKWIWLGSFNRKKFTFTESVWHFRSFNSMMGVKRRWIQQWAVALQDVWCKEGRTPDRVVIKALILDRKQKKWRKSLPALFYANCWKLKLLGQTNLGGATQVVQGNSFRALHLVLHHPLIRYPARRTTWI